MLDQVRNKCRLQHKSIRTEQAYVDWIRRFILFHNKRHPRDMGAADIEAFLTHLPVAVATAERDFIAEVDASGSQFGAAKLAHTTGTGRLAFNSVDERFCFLAARSWNS